MTLRKLPATLTLYLATCASLASAAWHNEHAGDDVRAHHVHLSGHSADNEHKRLQLQQEQQACAEINASLGKPAAPSSGIPLIIDQQDVDIYYTAGQTATLTAGRRYVIDRDNCSVKALESHTLRLFGDNAGESCTIDLLKRRANGLCLPPEKKGKPQNVAESPGVDLAKVPPHLRDDAQRTLARISKQKRHAPTNGSLPATSEFRTIAGIKCRVHRHATLPLEKCIAQPDSVFPIPPSSFHAGLPGLLLYMTIGEQAPTLTASEVHLDIGLRTEAFAVPADIRRDTGKR